MNYIEDVGPETYEIKKIIMADGTEFDIDKITGLAVVKESGSDIQKLMILGSLFAEIRNRLQELEE